MQYFKKGLFTVLGIWSGIMVTSVLNGVICGIHEPKKSTTEKSEDNNKTTE